MSFFEELKRRNGIKVGIAYAVGACLNETRHSAGV